MEQAVPSVETWRQSIYLDLAANKGGGVPWADRVACARKLNDVLLQRLAGRSDECRLIADQIRHERLRER